MAEMPVFSPDAMSAKRDLPTARRGQFSPVMGKNKNGVRRGVRGGVGARVRMEV